MKKVGIALIIGILTIGLTGCGTKSIEDFKEEINFNILTEEYINNDKTRMNMMMEVDEKLLSEYSKDIEIYELNKVQLFNEIDKDLTFDKLKEQIVLEEEKKLNKRVENRELINIDEYLNTDIAKDLGSDLQAEVSKCNESIELFNTAAGAIAYNGGYYELMQLVENNIEFDKSAIPYIKLRFESVAKEKNAKYSSDETVKQSTIGFFVRSGKNTIEQIKKGIVKKIDRVNEKIEDLNQVIKLGELCNSPYSNEEIQKIIKIQEELVSLGGTVESNKNKYEENKNNDNNSNNSNNNNSNNNKYYTKVTNKDDRVFAWTVAEKEVKNRLKNPKSAKFPFSAINDRVDITKSGSNYVVKSYVDAENGFGGIIRSEFVVEFERDGTYYTVTNVVIK